MRKIRSSLSLQFLFWPAAGLLLFCFALLAVWSIRTTSLTFDEPLYITAGMRHLQGDFTINPEHPPLAKELIALPVSVLRDIGVFPETLSIIAFAPFFRITSLLAGLATVALCGWWAWRIWSARSAALLSLGFAAFDPNLLANASVATLDIFLAFFTTLTLYLLWETRAHPRSLMQTVAIGIAFGCALATKTPAFLLLPFILFFLRPVRGQSYVRISLPSLLLLLVIALLTVMLTYGMTNSAVYIQGMLLQIAHAGRGHPSFLLGWYSMHGWLLYYPFAMLVKTPIPTLLAAGLGITALVKRKKPDATAALFVFPLVVLLAMSLSHIDIGLRYLLPMYPPLFVAAGILAIGKPLPYLRRTLPVILVAATALSTVIQAPHFLSYFNEAIGPRANATQLLSDSNIDWGQDMKELADYQKSHRLPIFYLAAFSSEPPESYGVSAQLLPGFSPTIRTKQLLVAPDGPQFLAISITVLQGTYFKDHGTYRWLLDRQPTARIGTSILLYDMTDERSLHATLADIYTRYGFAALAARESTFLKKK